MKRPSATASDCPNCSVGQVDTSRRLFLTTSSIAISTVLLKHLFPNRVHAQDGDTEATLAEYPRVRIGAVGDLEADTPVPVEYPDNVAHNGAMLVKLGGVKAGGGVGDDQDIVAFSTRCTHMGGDLSSEYNAQFKLAGPCREHLTTFDLTRHGMVVTGHATQSLPQLVLEIEGDEIFAVGIVGLLYGHHAQPIAAT